MGYVFVKAYIRFGNIPHLAHISRLQQRQVDLFGPSTDNSYRPVSSRVNQVTYRPTGNLSREKPYNRAQIALFVCRLNLPRIAQYPREGPFIFSSTVERELRSLIIKSYNTSVTLIAEAACSCHEDGPRPRSPTQSIGAREYPM